MANCSRSTRRQRAQWKYQAVSRDIGIGSSSPAVSGNFVYVGDPRRPARGGRDTGTVRGRSRPAARSNPRPSSPAIVLAAAMVILCARSDHREAHLEVLTDNYVHATPALLNGIAYFGGRDEVFHGVRVADGSRRSR
jgi:hypothetical protein